MNPNSKYGHSTFENSKKPVEYDGISKERGPKRAPSLFTKDIIDGKHIMKQYKPEINKTGKAVKRCLKKCLCCSQ